MDASYVGLYPMYEKKTKNLRPSGCELPELCVSNDGDSVNALSKMKLGKLMKM